MKRTLTAACIALTACGGAHDEHTVTRATVDTLPGGIVQVRNDGPTLWADTSGWRIVLVVERKFPSGEPGAMEHPNFPVVLDDGSVVVVNQKPAYLARYSPTLEPLGNFSREGDGPGEVRSPIPVAAFDSLFVIDQNRSVIIAFDRDGHFAREAPIRFRPNDVGAVDHGRIALTSLLTRRQQILTWWDLRRNAVVDSVVPPLGPEPVIIKRCSFGLPYQPQLGIVGVAPGIAWWGVSDGDRFYKTHSGHDTTVIASSNRPRVPVSDSVLDKMLGPESFAVKQCGPIPERSQVPKMKPAWRDLYADSAGNLWVHRSGVPRASFDVYAPDGQRLGQVPDPFRADENWGWHGERATSVEEFDDGSFTLRVYRIDRTNPKRAP